MNNEAREADAFADFRGGRNLGELSARSAFRAGWDAALALPVSGVTDNTALIAEAREFIKRLDLLHGQDYEMRLFRRILAALESQQGSDEQEWGYRVGGSGVIICRSEAHALAHIDEGDTLVRRTPASPWIPVEGLQ